MQAIHLIEHVLGFGRDSGTTSMGRFEQILLVLTYCKLQQFKKMSEIQCAEFGIRLALARTVRQEEKRDGSKPGRDGGRKAADDNRRQYAHNPAGFRIDFVPEACRF